MSIERTMRWHRAYAPFAISIVRSAYVVRSLFFIVIAQSSCGAENVAAAAAANEIVWWRRLLSDFGSGPIGPTKLYCDNKAASILARHSGRFEATKHIGLRLHVLRRYQENKVVDVVWLPATNMIADIMTKNTEPKLFRRLASIVMGEPV